MAQRHLPAKVCATCGRTFTWRKKWARRWAEIAHCSDRCRSRRKRDETSEFETRILALLAQRARGASICPSEVLADQDQQDGQGAALVRAAARQLAHRATIDILQRGLVVDPDHARGPVRLRLR